jgi:hypothetical protein
MRKFSKQITGNGLNQSWRLFYFIFFLSTKTNYKVFIFRSNSPKKLAQNKDIKVHARLKNIIDTLSDRQLNITSINAAINMLDDGDYRKRVRT